MNFIDFLPDELVIYVLNEWANNITDLIGFDNALCNKILRKRYLSLVGKKLGNLKLHNGSTQHLEALQWVNSRNIGVDRVCLTCVKPLDQSFIWDRLPSISSLQINLKDMDAKNAKEKEKEKNGCVLDLSLLLDALPRLKELAFIANEHIDLVLTVPLITESVVKKHPLQSFTMQNCTMAVVQYDQCLTWMKCSCPALTSLRLEECVGMKPFLLIHHLPQLTHLQELYYNHKESIKYSYHRYGHNHFRQEDENTALNPNDWGNNRNDLFDLLPSSPAGQITFPSIRKLFIKECGSASDVVLTIVNACKYVTDLTLHNLLDMAPKRKQQLEELIAAYAVDQLESLQIDSWCSDVLFASIAEYCVMKQSNIYSNNNKNSSSHSCNASSPSTFAVSSAFALSSSIAARPVSAPVIGCKRLTKLSLFALGYVTDECLFYIAKFMPHLTSFSVQHNTTLTSSGFYQLITNASSSWLPKLTSLVIENVHQLSTATLLKLVEHCTGLQELILNLAVLKMPVRFPHQRQEDMDNVNVSRRQGLLFLEQLLTLPMITQLKSLTFHNVKCDEYFNWKTKQAEDALVHLINLWPSNMQLSKLSLRSILVNETFFHKLLTCSPFLMNVNLFVDVPTPENAKKQIDIPQRRSSRKNKQDLVPFVDTTNNVLVFRYLSVYAKCSDEINTALTAPFESLAME